MLLLHYSKKELLLLHRVCNMATLGIETETNIGVNVFMQQSNERLQNDNIVKNPFNGRIKKIYSNKGKDSYVIIMNPIYPRIYLIGLFLMVVPLFFTGFYVSWWLLPGAIIFSLGIFWSKIFVLLGLFIGLRKHGYKGKVKYLSNNEIIRRMVL